MKALVVHEPADTAVAAIAEAVAAGLADAGASVEHVDVDDAPSGLQGVDLLVLGGRTETPRVARWMRELPRAEGARATAFEVRGADRRPTRWGMVQRLRRRGFDLVLVPERFVVGAGGVSRGERHRARAWGRALGVLARPGVPVGRD